MVLKFLYVLDTAKTQLYHFNAIIIAGTGLFPDAYDRSLLHPFDYDTQRTALL